MLAIDRDAGMSNNQVKMAEGNAEVIESRDLSKEEIQNHAKELMGKFTGVLNKNPSYKKAKTAYDYQEESDINLYENGKRYDVEIGDGFLNVTRTLKERTPEAVQTIVQLQDPSQDPTGLRQEAIVAFQSDKIFSTREGDPNRHPVRGTTVALEETGKFLKELDADLSPQTVPA